MELASELSPRVLKLKREYVEKEAPPGGCVTS